MKKLIFAAVFFLISSTSFSAEFSDFVIVKVNNKAITNSEVDDRYQFVLLTSKLNIKDADEKKILREQIIDKMIDEELIRQESKNLKIEVSEKDLKDGIEIVAAHRKQTSAQFKAFLQRNRLSFENYSTQIEAEILWSKIVTETLRGKVKISDVEVKEFLEQHELSSDVRKFFLAEILISPSDNAGQFSEKLVAELRGGADFQSLAKQFSSAIDSEIGWVSQGDIDPKIYSEVSKLGKDEYSYPVQLTDGYHIFKLLDSKIETKIAEQDLNAAKNAIFSRKLQTLAKGYLMDLRKRAFVEVKR